jgi:tetratricopeptide (TPR) repeat protein
MLLRTLDAPAVEAPGGEDPMAMLVAGRYAELDAALMDAQTAYTRGEITDEQLIVQFRPFYDVSNPDIERHFDEWVRSRPDSYVARLARGIHYKYVGLEARGEEYASRVSDARMAKRNAAYARAASDLAESINLDARPLLSFHYLIDPSDSLLWFRSNRGLLDEAIALDPNNIIVRRKYLTTLPKRWGGSLEKMEAFLRECRDARLPVAHLEKLEHIVAQERAMLVFKQGNDPALAQRMFAELVAADPDDVRSAEHYLSTLVKLKKWDEAVAAATRLLQRHPHDSHALANRGLSYVHLKKFDDGVKDYEAAADLGNVWAQKELARLHWQGRFVVKDRPLALRLLRKAAESGDPEAVREHEKRTGEKIVTRIHVWQKLLPFAALALPLIALGAWVEYRRGREPADICARRLTYSIWRWVGAAIGFGLALGVLVDAMNGMWSLGKHVQFAIALAFAIWALCFLASYLFVRHDVRTEGLSLTRFTGTRADLLWGDVARVTFMPVLKHFKLETRAGSSFYISNELQNVAAFAKELLDRVPSDVISLQAAAWLKGFQDFAEVEWSDEDLAALGAVQAPRIVLPGGTDVAEVALFSLDSLPLSRNLDAESAAELEARQGAIRIETGSDGGFLMHLYVEVPVPEAVRKFCAPDTRRAGVLRAGSGRIAFGGVESMCSDFPGNPHIRSDAVITPGDYDVDVALMAFPGEMIEDALQSAAPGLYSPWMKIRPAVIAVTILGAVGASFIESWWLAAGLLALAVTTGAWHFSSGARREAVTRAHDVESNFPSLVAELRLRR